MTGRIWVKAQEPVPTVHVNMEIYQTGRYKEAASVENLSGDTARKRCRDGNDPAVPYRNVSCRRICRQAADDRPTLHEQIYIHRMSTRILQGARSRGGGASRSSLPRPSHGSRTERSHWRRPFRGQPVVAWAYAERRRRGTPDRQQRSRTADSNLRGRTALPTPRSARRTSPRPHPSEPRQAPAATLALRADPPNSAIVALRPDTEAGDDFRTIRQPEMVRCREQVAPVEVRVGDVLFDDKDVNSQTKEGIQSLRRQLRPSLNRGQDHV